MASNLPFEYTPRISDIAEQVSAGTLAGPDLQRLLEKRDQDLEDFLATVGGGGTAQSFLGVFGGPGDRSGVISTTSTTLTDIVAVPIPADTGFDYYIDWRISGRTDWLGTESIEAAGTASFAEFPPGTGYEIYGYSFRGAQAPTAVDPGRIITHGQRMEGPVPGPQLGTTVHLHHVYAFTATGSTTINSFISSQALLFAIPH